jgi:putative N6-adenine-specific DNA methylase
MGQGQPEDEVLFLQSSPGLEAVVAAEARSLGKVRPVRGGAELSGPRGQHAEANLRLRATERVLLRCLEMPVAEWRQARAALAAVRLDHLAAAGSPVALELATRLPGRPADAAIRSWLGQAWGRSVDPPGADNRSGQSPRLLLRSEAGRLTLSADTSGELLHRRGWRQEVSRAPMRETLAAGILMLAGFDPAQPLWDPLCGSGTLVIEAALAARRVAPGLGRRFAAEEWPMARTVDWAGIRARLVAETLETAPSSILGSDLNAGSLGTARRNAKRAGVLDDLRLQRVDLAAAQPEGLEPGLLVANLPYGRRVGTPASLRALDTALANALRTRFRRWRAALLVDDAGRLERSVGRLPDSVHALRNGGIPVALAIYEPGA